MYSLNAIVGRTSALELEPLIYQSARLVRLEGGVSMIPLGEALLSEIQQAGAVSALAHPAGGPFEFLSPAVETWIKVLAAGSSTAYVETEYFGGEGFERAAVWTQGVLSLGPMDGAGSINQALRSLGVITPPGTEEFKFVGLDRHRSLEEWLQDPV